jgi:hypothetical protein
MSPSENKNLYVVMSIKVLRLKLLLSSSMETLWRRRFYLSASSSPEIRRR